MSKNKPKTIADLNINWTFDWHIEFGIFEKIQELNPEIKHLKIVKNSYRFVIDGWDFSIQTIDTETLTNLLWRIDGSVFCLQSTDKLSKVLVLDRFELIKENEFRIHVKS